MDLFCSSGLDPCRVGQEDHIPCSTGPSGSPKQDVIIFYHPSHAFLLSLVYTERKGKLILVYRNQEVVCVHE